VALPTVSGRERLGDSPALDNLESTMRSTLNRVQFSVLVLGLVGACGSSSSPSNNGNGYWPDAGHGNNAYGDSGSSGQNQFGDSGVSMTGSCYNYMGFSVAPCQTPSGTFQVCQGNQPTGQCMSATQLLGGGADGGGLPFQIPDGGLPIIGGDGGLPQIGAAKPCPSPLTCGVPMAAGSAILGNSKYCLTEMGVPGILSVTVPPSSSNCAMTGTACTDMGLSGNCLVIANPLQQGSQLKVCAQACP
jgi:hypothetical protein